MCIPARGLALVNLQRASDAIADFTSAMKFMPDDPWCYVPRAGAYAETDQWEKSCQRVQEGRCTQRRLL